MPRRKRYDYAGQLHKRGLTTECKAHRAFIMTIGHDLRKQRAMPPAGGDPDVTRRAIVAEIDRRNGGSDAAE